MKNLSRILSPSRNNNNRSTSMKRKNSITRKVKSKSKAAKLHMSYVSPLHESRESSLKNKRYNSTHKLAGKNGFPNIKNKIKPTKGFQSYLNSMTNLPTAINKANVRKSRIVNKTQNFGMSNSYYHYFVVIKTSTKGLESQTSMSKDVSESLL